MPADRAPVSPKTITAATLQDNLGVTATKPRAAHVMKINTACTNIDSTSTTAHKPKIKLVSTRKVAPANKENMGATVYTSEVKATPDSDDIGTKIIDPAISHLSSHKRISPFQSLYDEEKKRANISIATNREAERVRVQKAHEFTKKLQEAQKAHSTEFEGAHARGAHFSRAHRAPGNVYESNNRRHVVRAPPGDVEPSEWSHPSSVPASRHQDSDNKPDLPLSQSTFSMDRNESFRRTAKLSVARQDTVKHEVTHKHIVTTIIKTPDNMYKKLREEHAARAAYSKTAHVERVKAALSNHTESIPSEAIRATAVDAAHSAKVIRPTGGRPQANSELTPEQIQAVRAFTKACMAEDDRIRALRRQENKETKAPKFPRITAQAVPYIIASTAEGVDRIENPKASAEDVLNKLQAARSIDEKETQEERVVCKERGGHKVSRAANDMHNQQRTEQRARNLLQPQVLENAVDLSLILESDQIIGQNREVGAPVIQKDWGTYQGAVTASGEIVLGAINCGFGAGVLVKKVADTLLDNKIEKRLCKSRKKWNLEGKPEIIDLPEHEELICGEECIVEDGNNLGGEEWEKL